LAIIAASDAVRTCYIVSFEVAAVPSRTRLVGLLRGFKSYCPINRHCWAVMSDLSAAAIRDHLVQVLGARDRIFVVRSGTEAAWRNAFGPKNSEWLKKNL
jgi:hypothetical protein